MKPVSFVIITYNRPADMLELAKNIAGLDGAAELLEEVIIVNNASTDDYSALAEFILQTPSIPFIYHYSNENLGVARGRNLAISLGKAPILIMLDDDAVMQNPDCLHALLAEFAKEDSTRPKALISFKVLYYDTLEMQVNALPHKKFREHKDLASFETYYYAGGAHAIRRAVLETTGNYPEDFFYGMEEYDLSFRILDAGYSIVYSDKAVMLHKESPLGRKPKKEKIRMMWVNKTKVAWRYLPAKYFWTTACMWSLFYLKNTGFHIGGFFQGWREVFAIRSKTKRTPISNNTLEYLKSVDARIAY